MSVDVAATVGGELVTVAEVDAREARACAQAVRPTHCRDREPARDGNCAAGSPSCSSTERVVAAEASALRRS